MKISAQDIQISSAKLPGKLSAFIFRDAAHLNEDEPFYAINWFNTKSSLVYDFYNYLAVRSVRKIGGEPFFKGRHLKTLHGSADDSRDVLLVVRYPAVTNFRKMLESKVFQAVSVIRMAAVKDFTFGFTKRGDAGADLIPLDHDEKTIYGVFNYSGTKDTNNAIDELASETNVEIFYKGLIRAHIGTGETSSEATQVPCVMDGIFIVKSADSQAVENLMQTPAFISLNALTERSFFGLYNRIL